MNHTTRTISTWLRARRRNEMALLEYEANGMDGDVLTSIRQTLENSGMFLDRIDTVEIDPDEEGWC